MNKIINQDFFKKNSETVALELMKSNLVRKIKGKEIKLEVNEVEIYDGFLDKASHASSGKTKRNEVMFKGGGIFYIYLVYGMYFMINIVTGKENYPSAILIRGAGDLNGPGKLSNYLKVDYSLNGKEIGEKNGLWFEKIQNKVEIKKTSRIGVNYAGNYWSKAPLRFLKIR